MAADETPETSRYVVTGGGEPTPEELAAVVVALTPVVAVPAEDDARPTSGAASQWAHAAILEGVGHRTFVAMPDLAAGRFPLG